MRVPLIFAAIVLAFALSPAPVADSAADSVEIGVIGNVADAAEDGKSFELKAKGLPKSTFVFDDKETKIQKV
ncbi:MAG: hypothetical protein KDC38_12830, partial [Planctomycetes bacterium]|nr:hypothetical protein [Planctomycetota bacterium]